MGIRVSWRLFPNRVSLPITRLVPHRRRWQVEFRRRCITSRIYTRYPNDDDYMYNSSACWVCQREFRIPPPREIVKRYNGTLYAPLARVSYFFFFLSFYLFYLLYPLLYAWNPRAAELDARESRGRRWYRGIFIHASFERGGVSAGRERNEGKTGVSRRPRDWLLNRFVVCLWPSRFLLSLSDGFFALYPRVNCMYYPGRTGYTQETLSLGSIVSQHRSPIRDLWSLYRTSILFEHTNRPRFQTQS